MLKFLANQFNGTFYPFWTRSSPLQAIFGERSWYSCRSTNPVFVSVSHSKWKYSLYVQESYYDLLGTGKNCYYRMMTRASMDWRKLQMGAPVVVRQQGVPTRLDRGADCSQQTCWLDSAGLPSLVATMEKLLPSTRNDTFSNPRRYSFRHGKKLFPTRKDAYPPPLVFIPSFLNR